MEDLSVSDMGTGLLVGLAALEKPLSGWKLRSSGAHKAAAAVYDYLESLGVFRMDFSVTIDRRYGTSPVWSGEVSYMFSRGLLSVWMPRGTDYDLLVDDTWLGTFCDPKQSIPGLPGNEKLWLQCAEIFCWAYEDPSRYLP